MFIELVRQCELEMDIYVRFKDDINILMDRLTEANPELEKILGMQYEGPENFEGNFEEYTAKMMSNLANNVCDMIKFTYDTPSKNIDGWLPVLDVKVQVSQDNKIIHNFYEKPTRNKNVIFASSALSWTQKRSIHTQELLRRMKNTSIYLDEKVQNEHVSMYLLRMKKCGYNQKFRSEVLKSAKSAYKKIFEKHKYENIPMYRNRRQLEEAKSLKKCSAQNWWQQTKSKKSHTAILFVPPTPQGGLAKALRKRESELNSTSKKNIRIIEQGGTKIKSILTKSDPFPTVECDVRDCPYCQPTPLIEVEKVVEPIM